MRTASLISWELAQIQPLRAPRAEPRKPIRLKRADDDGPLDARQRDALGVIHDRLRTLTVGVVGCGGLGSPIAEQLDRMGVAEIVLVDHDLLDTDSNVRRVFGSTLADLNASTPHAKVDVVGPTSTHSASTRASAASTPTSVPSPPSAHCSTPTSS